MKICYFPLQFLVSVFSDNILFYGDNLFPKFQYSVSYCSHSGSNVVLTQSA